MTVPRKVIEYPMAGATYSREEYGVYEYSEPQSGSVLEGTGRQVRKCLGSYDSLDEALAAHPGAEWHGEGYTEYDPRPLPVDPPYWHTSDMEPWDDGEEYT